MSKKGKNLRDENTALRAEIAKLEARVAELETVRHSTKPTKKTDNKYIAYGHGWNDAWFIFEQKLDPIFKNLIALSTIAGNIVGSSLRGDGQLAKQHNAKLTDVMVIFLNRTDDAIKSAVDFFGEDFRYTLDVSQFGNILRAAKEFNQTGNGDKLRELATAKNQLYADLRLDYENLKRGAKKKGEVIAEKVQDFINDGHQVKDAIEMTVQFYQKRYQHPTKVEKEAAISVRKSAAPADLVKAHYYNHKEKTTALNAWSEE